MSDFEMPILVWPWEDAPDLLRALSEHGGDEDWLVHVPPHFVDYVTRYGLPRWIEAMGPCDVSEHRMQDGSIVYIAAHS